MTFRLFGVPVEIQTWFWITTLLLGWDPSVPGKVAAIRLAVWVPVVLVSILVHEFGHAFAVMRHKIQPEIVLQGLFGLCRYRAVVPLRRRDEVIISLAGPFAGFVLGGAALAAKVYIAGFYAGLPAWGKLAVDDLIWVNVQWGLVNLLPIWPLDGGQALASILGPTRARASALISLIAAALAASFFAIVVRQLWGAMFFGLFAIQSYQRFEAEGSSRPARASSSAAPPPNEEMPIELSVLLQSARHALAADDLDRALALAQRVLEGDGGAVEVTPRAVLGALEVTAWAHLLAGRIPAANEVLTHAMTVGGAGDVDPALIGAVLFARRELKEARKVLEAARARGDQRKEIVGPLIQILLELGETGRAAEAAIGIAEQLSDEDLTKMAQITLEGRAFDRAAHLYELVFDRTRSAEDAFQAARAWAQDDRPDKALTALEKAVAAGFSDAQRAWSDTALKVLHQGDRLAALLPRP